MKNKIINALYWACVAIGAVELSKEEIYENNSKKIRNIQNIKL